MTVAFELDGQDFTALNGGPHFKFTGAISLVVNCETQNEVDHFWEKLSAGGQEVQCGWLTDRYGVSWQIVPTVLPEMLQDKDPEKARRVTTHPDVVEVDERDPCVCVRTITACVAQYSGPRRCSGGHVQSS